MSRTPVLARSFFAVALAAAALSAPSAASGLGAGVEASRGTWPVSPPVVARPFVAPAHDYGAGHRGVDLGTRVGAEVVAPAAGTVAFVGRVVDRGVLTLDHGEGRVTSYEPVESDLVPGALVNAGDRLGVVDRGGHAPEGQLHVGLRRDGAYLDPLLLFGTGRRAVLLPWREVSGS